MQKRLRVILTSIAALAVLLAPGVAYASLTPNFTQTISAGTLSANIYQSDDATPVASPSVAFPAQNMSFQCQTSTGTLGDSSDKLNVTNLSSTVSTWNLAIAPTSGDSATWSDGSGHSYKFNDATGSGCTNGQMTVNASAATLTDDCSSSCTANDSTVSKGSSTTYVSGSVSSATLLSDTAGTAWEGYLTGISISQKIPPMTHSGSYSLGMTITLTNT